MDVSHILDSLNDQQRNAVASPAPHLLVLAGAGSGKTRVLVHRVAWLIQAEQVSPFGILAVTFTNKAAREMRGRIDELVGQSFGGIYDSGRPVPDGWHDFAVEWSPERIT